MLAITFLILVLIAQVAWAGENTAVNEQEKILQNFPSYSQESTGWCAWVSAQMVLSYYGYSVSPQAVAIETFEGAGQTWGAKDSDGLPWRYYTSYEAAIRSLSNDRLETEEISAQDKDEVLYKIFEAIDRGNPVIILSGGPWLYDATDLPELTSLEVFPESSWPSGDHASVIVGYSLNQELNNLAALGLLTFFSNLIDSPPVVMIHDPATAAINVGEYWVSYDKLFEKTLGYPSVTRLIIVKPKAVGSTPPKIEAFQVSQPGLTLGESIAIDYTVSDNSGSGLKQVELWRNDGKSDWQETDRIEFPDAPGSYSGTFSDTPSSPGDFWYGIHVVDNAGNWNDENNTNTNYEPDRFGPMQVVVVEEDTSRIYSELEMKSVENTRDMLDAYISLMSGTGSGLSYSIKDAKQFSSKTEAARYLNEQGLTYEDVLQMQGIVDVYGLDGSDFCLVIVQYDMQLFGQSMSIPACAVCGGDGLPIGYQAFQGLMQAR